MDTIIIDLKIIFSFSAIFWSVVVSRLIVQNWGMAAVKDKDIPKGIIMHDYIFNFISALLGWVALYYFVFVRLIPAGSKFTLTITDLIVVTIALVGIMGYLPHLIINKGFKP